LSSLQERYGSHAGNVNAVTDRTKAFVAERFLLEEDADRFIKQAETGDVLAVATSSGR
jgi:hypothetical protein